MSETETQVKQLVDALITVTLNLEWLLNARTLTPPTVKSAIETDIDIANQLITKATTA